jgi:hypothetical protein
MLSSSVGPVLLRSCWSWWDSTAFWVVSYFIHHSSLFLHFTLLQHVNGDIDS